MARIMRGRLAGSVLSGLAFIVAMAACQARAESSPLAQEIVLATRNPSAGLGQFHALHHRMRRERVVRRHFRGPRVIGVENGAVGVPVPVPQENDEVYPLEPSFGGFGYRPFPPPPLVAPPQIITLPTPKTAGRNVVRRAPSSPAPIRHWNVVEVRRRAPIGPSPGLLPIPAGPMRWRSSRLGSRLVTIRPIRRSITPRVVFVLTNRTSVADSAMRLDQIRGPFVPRRFKRSSAPCRM
jgi:hypothetical protein